MPATRGFHLEPDLATGVVPVSRAASALAALIKQALASRRPIVITQKGFPTGILISVEMYTALCAIVEQAAQPAPAEEPA